MDKPIRIRVVVPLVGLTASALTNRREMLDQHREGRTQIEFAVIRKGPSSIESAYDEVFAGHEVVGEVVRAEREGSDAVILWCASDPALEAAREVSSIPIVGPIAASCHVASLLADRFTVITVLEQLAPVTRRKVEGMGLGNKLASVRAVHIPVLDLEAAEAGTLDRLMKEAEAAIRQDGAEALVLGCMGMINLSSQLAARLDSRNLAVPVVNPAIASLKVAEMLASLGLSHSKLCYPSPRKVEGL